MKGNRIKLLVAGLLVLSLLAVPLVAACAKPAPAPAPAPKPAPAPAPAPKEEVQKHISIGGVTTGTTYIMGAAEVDLLRRYTDIEVSYERTGGAKPSYTALTAGDIHLYNYSPVFISAAMRGVYGPELLKLRVRLLGAGGEKSKSFFAVVTRPDTGIKKVTDLRGKRFYAERAGSPQFGQFSKAILKANGMTEKDVVWLMASSSEDAKKDMVEKRVDAWSYVLGKGTIEIAETVGLYILPVTLAEQQALVEANPAFLPATITKGDRGATVDTPVVGAPTSIWISPKVNEITGYTIIKALYDHQEDFKMVHSATSGFDLKYAMDVWVIPYHPGAIKFYKEEGMWTAEHDKKQQELLATEKELTGW